MTATSVRALVYRKGRSYRPPRDALLHGDILCYGRFECVYLQIAAMTTSSTYPLLVSVSRSVKVRSTTSTGGEGGAALTASMQNQNTSRVQHSEPL